MQLCSQVVRWHGLVTLPPLLDRDVLLFLFASNTTPNPILFSDAYSVLLFTAM